MSLACVLHHLHVGSSTVADGRADALPISRCTLGHSTNVIMVLMPWDPSVDSKPGAYEQRLKVHLLSQLYWQGILLGGALRSQRADVRLECKYAESNQCRWLTLAAEKHSSLHSGHLHTSAITSHIGIHP